VNLIISVCYGLLERIVQFFFGHVPFPLVHIDTHYKIPEMIKYRDNFAKEWKLDMIYGKNTEDLRDKLTFQDGNATRLQCCKNLKTDDLVNTLNGNWPRYRLNHELREYEVDQNKEPFTGVIVGARADEEGSRSKERYFRQEIKIVIGKLKISLLNFGINIKLILH